MEKAAAQRTKERGGEPVPALPSNLKIQNRKMVLSCFRDNRPHSVGGRGGPHWHQQTDGDEGHPVFLRKGDSGQLRQRGFHGAGGEEAGVLPLFLRESTC